MRAYLYRALSLRLVPAAALLLLLPATGKGQETSKPAADIPSGTTAYAPALTPAATDVQALARAVRDLQAEVQSMHAEMDQIRMREQQAHDEARELRRELRLANPQSSLLANAATYGTLVGSGSGGGASTASPNPATSAATDSPQEESTSDRLGRLEEDEQLNEGKLNDQYQTKVESASKYKLRLSGIVLFNVFANRGVVDNQDFPHLALEREADDPTGTFGASLRQSQIGVQAIGPEIAGAHTSADLNFDFAGGFPDTPNGVATGIVRLRTGTIRLDWANTSVIAGQDRLFFAPLAPTSLASLANPALSYAGNLWSWTPQVRVEHKIHVSESSTLLFQGGILDSFTGQSPDSEYYRTPNAGESSAQPAYATRVAWSHQLFGQDLIAGFGSYYGRQNWQFGRHVDSWAGTADLTVPLGHLFEFTGAFYRGRAVGGIGGGIDQSVITNTTVSDPLAVVQGLDSVGGWAQLKFKPHPKYEFNAAFGHDNPFGNEIARFSVNPVYYDDFFARNQTWFTNFIFQPRSDVAMSIEFRRLRTFGTDGEADTANQVNLSLGYLF